MEKGEGEKVVKSFRVSSGWKRSCERLESNDQTVSSLFERSKVRTSSCDNFNQFILITKIDIGIVFEILASNLYIYF